jgi:hypothetical protein
MIFVVLEESADLTPAELLEFMREGHRLGDGEQQGRFELLLRVDESRAFGPLLAGEVEHGNAHVRPM